MILFGKIKGSEDGWIFGFNEEMFESYIEMTAEEHMETIRKANEENKLIKGDKNGRPILVDMPKPPEREKKQTRIEELEIYLKSTDWYAIRFADTGEEMPADIKKKRQDARNEISLLREELDSDTNSSGD